MKLLGLKLIFLSFMSLRVEGSCSVEHCTDPRRCVLSEDRRSCRCTAGFYSARCDQSAGIKVMCGRDYMSIRASEDFFSFHGVPLEALRLPNASCRAQREVIAGTPFYMFRISRQKYLACGGKPLEKNATHLLYSLTVQSDPRVNGNIIRDPGIRMDFTCVYPSVRRVSLPFPVFPVSSETVMQVDEMDATVQMLLYADGTFTKAYSRTPTIELRDEVFVEVAVTEPADYFLLRVNDCWATLSSQPNSTGPLHHLIHNGCVDDPTVTFLHPDEDRLGDNQRGGADNKGGTSGGGADMGGGANGGGARVRYSFQMFRFTTGPRELYLHCSVQLCEREDPQACLPNCNAISKREALRAYPSQGLLSYGPIRVELPDRPESSVLTMVVLPVGGAWILGFFLTVLIVVAKAGRRRIPKAEAL